MLDHGVENRYPRRAAQLLQLLNGCIAVKRIIGFHAHDDGPFVSFRFAVCLFFGKLSFERADKRRKIRIDRGGMDGRENLPETPFGVFRNEMGDMGADREAIQARLDRADEIEAKQGKIDQVVGGQLLAVQVGVYQPQAPETARGRAEGVKIGKKKAVVRPDDDKGDLAPAGEQDAYLPVYFSGQLGELSCQFGGDDRLRRDASLVETFQLFCLRRRQAGQLSINFFDRRFLGISMLHFVT